MRHELLATWMDSAIRRASGVLPACLLIASTGCQLASPQALSPRTSSSFKPPSSGFPTSTEASNSDTADPSGSPTTSATARIRGQSPNQWNSASNGSDSNRYPMPPSDSTAGGTNGGYTYSPTAAGQFATTPLNSNPSQGNNPQNPAVQSYPSMGQPVAPYGQSSPQTNTVLQPPTGPAPGTTGYGNPQYGYGAGGSYQNPGSYTSSPSDYGSSIAPGAVQYPNGQIPSTLESTLAPGVFPYDAGGMGYPNIAAPGTTGFQPRQRIAPLDVYLQEARTGRIILGGSVNSDLGVAGQLIIDERNFDITRWRREDFRSGRAFRGGGQNFRAEIMPGNQVQRYTINWTDPNFLDLPYSLSVGGFLYTRQFRDWTEQRLGGRVALGYQITKDLSISSELRLEDVNISSPRISGINELDSALGSNDLYTGRIRLARDTRDSPFMSTEGALLELILDQVFGEYDYSRANVNYSRYFLVRERPDGGGRHTLASTWRFGITGSQTPIFENYYAGGYSTLRGFSFRGASPMVSDVQVGGELMFLGSLEYVFPLTADEMLRGVAFVDYGTVEQDLTIDSENFRVAPGLGVRVTVPALGPAPLAFDFAYPINHADTDDRQVFSFFMGFTR